MIPGAEIALSFLQDKLKKDIALLGGLKNDVEWICNELAHMRAFLITADAIEDGDSSLSEWVREVREIAYDTEYIIDDYMLRFCNENNAHGCIGFMLMIYNWVKDFIPKCQLASQIQEIKTRVESASQRQKRYEDVYKNRDQGSSSSMTRANNIVYDGREDALLLEEAEVVGIEKPKKQLVEWLLSDNDGCKVISVVGMPGLGKTTLVKKVYDDASVKKKSDHHAWITVSESYKISRLLKDMIKQLAKEIGQPPPHGFEDMNDSDLRKLIYNSLKNKRYVIVLDDIWRIDAWNGIKLAFPRRDTTGHGFIIITSRYKDIGNAACTETTGYLYSLKPLSHRDSMKLFYRKAFPRDHLCPSKQLKDISEDIVSRCEGLPLAIVLIGSLLATKNNRFNEWEMFNRSLGPELEGDNLKRMRKLISHSYYDLPYYLKACFLYLSIFPEDHLIYKYSLFDLWISEGFVVSEGEKTKEEVAEGYLNELLDRSVIQVAEALADGTPRIIHVHDLLREYIISKARDENFMIVDNREEIRGSDKIRRLTVHGHVESIYPLNKQQNDDKFRYLRSLLIFGSPNSSANAILCKVLGGGCRMLKVLNIRGSSIDAIPNEVFKLYLLEILCIRDTHVRHIPKSIGNLKKLEILDLYGSMVSELPVEILELTRLHCLFVYKYKSTLRVYNQFDYVDSFKAPYEIGKLSCLQKLGFIEAGCGAGGIRIVKEVGKLTQLRWLGITKVRREDGKELSSSLAKLTNLRTLSIISAEVDEVIDLQYNNTALPFLDFLSLSGRLECMPPWISSLKNLTHLYLRWSRLRENHQVIECLQGLPNLVQLEMDSAYEGEGLCFKEGGGFLKLKKLFLSRLSCLRWVRVEKGSMPHLEELIIRNCRMMKEVPTGIEHLTNLSLVEFCDMSDEFLTRLSEKKRSEQLGKRVIHAFNWVEEGEISGWERREL